MAHDLTNWFIDATAHIQAAEITDAELQSNIDVPRIKEVELEPGKLRQFVSRDDKIKRNIQAAAITELSVLRHFNRTPTPAILREKIAELSNPQPGWETPCRLAREALEHVLAQLAQD
jgi:hypothetical protein